MSPSNRDSIPGQNLYFPPVHSILTGSADHRLLFP